jgi:hypothetical protein
MSSYPSLSSCCGGDDAFATGDGWFAGMVAALLAKPCCSEGISRAFAGTALALPLE